MDPEILVLLSGGIDSTACVHFYRDLRRPVCGLFIDYGQLAAVEERNSAVAVAKYYEIPLKELTFMGRKDKDLGLIDGRNLFLIAAAIMEKPSTILAIAMGIHAGTDYRDCSKRFFAKTQALVNLLELGELRLAAPFLTWNKAEIYEYCREYAVPTHLTYSCERGGATPCGLCLSCKDREFLRVSASINS